MSKLKKTDLFLGDETEVIFMSLKMEEGGDSAPFSGVASF